MKKSTKSPANFLVAYTQVLSVRRWISLLKNPIVLSCLSLFLMASNCDDDPEITPTTPETEFPESSPVKKQNPDGSDIFYEALGATSISPTSVVLRGKSNTTFPDEIYFGLALGDSKKMVKVLFHPKKDGIVRDGETYSLQVDNLKPSQDYVWIFTSSNARLNQYFTTLAVGEAIITTKDVKVQGNTATFSGKIVNSEDSPETYTFAYQKEGEEAIVIPQNQISGKATEEFTATINDLSAGKYTVKAIAKVADKALESESKTFNIVANSPSVVTNDPAVVGAKVTFSGKVTDTGGEAPTEYTFVYVNANKDSVTVAQDKITGSATEGYTATVDGLAAGDYTVLAKATNSAGTATGESKSFSIIAAPTAIINAPVVSENDVTFSGKVSDNGGEVPKAHTFIYTDTDGNETTVPQDDITGTAADGFTATVEDLPMGIYTVVATATNSAGTSKGENQSFTIEVGAPTVETTKATLEEGEFLVDLAGKVTNTNGSDITDYQFKITTPDSTTQTIVKSRIDGVPTDEFTFEADSLYDPGTYKIQAVATNQYGTTEGNALEYVVEGPPSFTIHTPDNPYTAKPEGETITLTFSTESDWEVGDITELLTFSKSSGSAGDNQSITVTIPANEFDTEQLYFVDFFVSGGDGETLGSLEITQAGVE